MIALRMLALLAGALVLIVPPILLADADSVGVQAWTVAVGLAGLATAAGSFIYVGMAGDRMRRGGPARMLGGLLLALPIAGCLLVLASRKDPLQLWGSGTLLAFSLLLFLSFVFPALERRQRPMRRRERSEPILTLVPRPSR